MVNIMEMSGSYVLLLLGGAASLLLWGTRMVRTGVTRAFGAEMRRILSFGASSRLAGVASGAAAAGALQSATAVALLTAAFARAGSLRVFLGLAIMLGADIGSAAMAALLTLDIKRLWPLLIFLGYVLHTINDGKSTRGKQGGRICLGVGLILLALSFMGGLAADLSASPVIGIMVQALGSDPIIAVLLLALLTWMAHSSIAMLLFVASLSAAGVLDDPALIVAMVLGVNLGGALPAITLTLSEPAEARRIMLGNGLFKLTGAVLGLLCLPLLVTFFAYIPGDAGFRTVMLHIGFNIIITVLFLPFLSQVERLLSAFLKSTAPETAAFGPIHLLAPPADVSPPVAVTRLLREVMRTLDMLDEMLHRCHDMLRMHQPNVSGQIATLGKRVDTLQAAIKVYATDLAQQELDGDTARRVFDIVTYETNLANAVEIVTNRLCLSLEGKTRARVEFSDPGQAEILKLFDDVLETNSLSAAALMSWDGGKAAELLERKRSFKAQVALSTRNHLSRFGQGEVRSIETSTYHLDIISDLQRVNALSASIAYAILDAQFRD